MTGGTNSNEWMQDNHDVWNNSMDLAGITNGGIVGFKYFGIGGLAQDTKGVKAFEGIKNGDGAVMYLNLTPGGHGAFKIHVLLDDPWKGKEIAVLDVPADAGRVANMYQIQAKGVEGLTGKHAIYLVAEGPEVQQPQQGRPQWGRQQQQPQRPQGLFDLHGIGFAKSSNGLSAPKVPQVTITVDGQQMRLPNTPLRSSNTNGYTDYSHYQAYAPLKANSVIKATASDPEVTIAVSPVVEGRATVTCTYKGLKKIYLIN